MAALLVVWGVFGRNSMILRTEPQTVWPAGSGRAMLFDQAKARLTELNRNRYAGYDDWRLPTLDEAMSLMTRPEDGIPYEMVAGSETKKAVYHLSGSFDVYGAPFIWTSDPASAGTVWVVYYADGICSPERSAMFNAYMRAVRSRR